MVFRIWHPPKKKTLCFVSSDKKDLVPLAKKHTLSGSKTNRRCMNNKTYKTTPSIDSECMLNCNIMYVSIVLLYNSILNHETIFFQQLVVACASIYFYKVTHRNCSDNNVHSRKRGHLHVTCTQSKWFTAQHISIIELHNWTLLGAVICCSPRKGTNLSTVL